MRPPKSGRAQHLSDKRTRTRANLARRRSHSNRSPNRIAYPQNQGAADSRTPPDDCAIAAGESDDLSEIFRARRRRLSSDLAGTLAMSRAIMVVIWGASRLAETSGCGK